MILPKGWRKAASEAWKDEAENAGAFANESPKSNFMNGFEQGAQEMLNAVEKEIEYLGSIGSNGRIYAADVIKLLQNIQPLNTEQK